MPWTNAADPAVGIAATADDGTDAPVPEDDLPHFQGEINAILGFVEQLNAIERLNIHAGDTVSASRLSCVRYSRFKGSTLPMESDTPCITRGYR